MRGALRKAVMSPVLATCLLIGASGCTEQADPVVARPKAEPSLERMQSPRQLYQMLIALPWFFLANWLFEPRLIYYVDARIALAFLYHGSLIAGLTFVAWTTLLRRLQVGQLSAFIFLTPISGVLLSRILLGDPLTPGLVAGLILVAAGIAVVIRPA